MSGTYKSELQEGNLWKSLVYPGSQDLKFSAKVQSSSTMFRACLVQRGETMSFLAEGRCTQRRIPSSGEHTDISQAGLENPLLTHFVKHVSSNDDEIHATSHNGRRNKEDMALSMPGHSRLEVRYI